MLTNSMENRRLGYKQKINSPVMYAFLMSIQNKNGGFYKDQNKGVFTIVDYYQLLNEIANVCEKRCPTKDPEARRRTLTSRWLNYFTVPAPGHLPFDLKIKRVQSYLISRLDPNTKIRVSNALVIGNVTLINDTKNNTVIRAEGKSPTVHTLQQAFGEFLIFEQNFYIKNNTALLRLVGHIFACPLSQYFTRSSLK